ncbi:ashwin-like [Littorina saxatilis]|uniref:Ashwin n=1 Tax=Littorina saxatilis TaxID=31220 RepID=A0AAN9GHK4_9CAEN
MAAPMEVKIPKIDWLYPELLSKEGLVEILSQRFVKLPDDTEHTSKDDLLELYYKYIIPRPQRQYRQNRRGREMTKKQILQSKKRKITGPDDSEPPAKYMKSAEYSRPVTSFDGVAVGNRLKPPPSCINFEKKVIKLGGSSTTQSPSNTANTTGLKVKDDTGTTGSTSPKVIKLGRSTSASSDPKSPTSPKKTISVNKTVKLINSHLSPSGDIESKKFDATHNASKGEQPMETDGSDSNAEKKPKRMKISWP